MNTPKSKEVKAEVHGDEEQDNKEKILNSGNEVKKKSFDSDKPEFKRPVEAEILEAVFQTDGQRIVEEKGETLPKEKQYKKHWLQCRFKYKDKDGNEKTFSQSYGSIREYDDRLWMGTANNLAELKGLYEEFAEEKDTDIWELGDKLVGKKCIIKSVSWAFGTKEGFTNKIQDFIEEK